MHEQLQKMESTKSPKFVINIVTAEDSRLSSTFFYVVWLMDLVYGEGKDKIRQSVQLNINQKIISFL